MGLFDLPMLKQLAVQLANTIVLCGVLSWLLYAPVKDFLRKRTERVRGQLQEAEDNMRQASEMKLQYETKLKDISRERDAILEAARQAAQEKEAQIITAARAEAEAIRNRAMLDIKLEEEKVRDDMKNQMIDISAAMASRWVSSAMDGSAQRRLLDEVISDLGDSRWLN
jgi:F-type H+-transporting ATPase subunit b